jgi:hypothetical protein
MECSAIVSPASRSGDINIASIGPTSLSLVHSSQLGPDFDASAAHLASRTSINPVICDVDIHSTQPILLVQLTAATAIAQDLCRLQRPPQVFLENIRRIQI